MEAVRRESMLTSMFLMLLSAGFLSFVGLFIHLAGEQFSLPVGVFLRFLCPFVVIGGIYFLIYGRFPQVNEPKWHFLRALYVVCAEGCFFWYMVRGDLVNGMLLRNTSPIFITLLVALIQRRRISLGTWFAVLISVCGVLLIIQPNAGIVSWYALVGLGAGFFAACSQILYHRLAKTESALGITVTLYALCALYTLLPFLFSPDGNIHFLVSVFGQAHIDFYVLIFVFCSFMTQICRTAAYRGVSYAAQLAPALYFTIVMAVIIEWLLYKRLPSHIEMLGGALIIGGNLLQSFLPEKQAGKTH